MQHMGHWLDSTGVDHVGEYTSDLVVNRVNFVDGQIFTCCRLLVDFLCDRESLVITAIMNFCHGHNLSGVKVTSKGYDR